MQNSKLGNLRIQNQENVGNWYCIPQMKMCSRQTKLQILHIWSSKQALLRWEFRRPQNNEIPALSQVEPQCFWHKFAERPHFQEALKINLNSHAPCNQYCSSSMGKRRLVNLVDTCNAIGWPFTTSQICRNFQVYRGFSFRKSMHIPLLNAGK